MCVYLHLHFHLVACGSLFFLHLNYVLVVVVMQYHLSLSVYLSFLTLLHHRRNQMSNEPLSQVRVLMVNDDNANPQQVGTQFLVLSVDVDAARLDAIGTSNAPPLPWGEINLLFTTDVHSWVCLWTHTHTHVYCFARTVYLCLASHFNPTTKCSLSCLQLAGHIHPDHTPPTDADMPDVLDLYSCLVEQVCLHVGCHHSPRY